MQQMIEMRPLGSTGLNLSAMGFGCASVWGKSMISDAQAQALMEQAYSLGVRYFDTAHSYGVAEERIGKILKSTRVFRREDIVLSSKCGVRIVDGKYVHDFTSDWAKKSVELSLQRMGIEYLDMLLLHGPRIADLTEEYLETIRDFKRRGICKAIGINTFDTDVLEYVRDTGCVDFVMLDYNILRQDREPLLQQLHDRGIGIIAGAPLAESLFSNRIFRIRKPKDVWYFLRAVAKFRGQLIEGRKFTFINNVPGMSGAQIALRYVLDNPNVTNAVFGTTTPSHLEDNMGALQITIPEDIRKKIRERA